MEHLQKLIKQRDDLEAEIEALTSYLNSPGNPGLHGGLVDKDGFPISDVEKILAVRESRNLLIRKQNDYDKLMSQIESGLYEYHSQLKQNPPPAASQPETGSHSKTDSPQHNEALPVPDYIKAKQPFAKVNQVAPMSPAYESKMHVGDLVIDFGGVDVTNNNNLIGVRDLVMKNENKALDLYVRRGADVLHLTLTPKKWSGQGLLGCHLLPHK
jgi:26S proteasome non-ATPase regulatory subunit 9